MPGRASAAARLAGGIALLLASAASADMSAIDPAQPVRVRNMAPAAFVYGLPAPQGPALGAGERALALHVEHANNFTGRRTDGVAVRLDGSTTVTSLAFRQGVGGWEWGVEVPFVHHGGGFTDRFIDDFHDLLGFPDGGRSRAPRNVLSYRVASGGETLIDIERSGGGLGDVRAWGGYRLAAGAARHASVRAQLKLPSGDADDLFGSGAADLSLWAELSDGRWLDALGVTVTLMGGLTVPGRGDVLGDRQRDAVLSGHLGLHYPLSHRLVLRAQLDGHTELLDTGVRAVGGASLQGTLGGSVMLPGRLRLDLALAEDLVTRSAPDVVFLVSLGRRW